MNKYKDFYKFQATTLAVVDGCGVSLSKPRENAEKIVKCVCDSDAAVVVFPELALTGSTCGDFFFDSAFLDELDAATRAVCDGLTKAHGKVAVIGLPFAYADRLYNAALVVYEGVVQGIVLKNDISANSIINEQRYFTSGAAFPETTINFAGAAIPVGTKLVFKFSESLVLGVEIGSDRAGLSSPAVELVRAGATVIANPSADAIIAGEFDLFKQCLVARSRMLCCMYIYAGSGLGESTGKVLLSGYTAIVSDGTLVAENIDFYKPTVETSFVWNPRWYKALRKQRAGFNDVARVQQIIPAAGEISSIRELSNSTRGAEMLLKKCPWNPNNEKDFYKNALYIQAHAFAKRMIATRAKSIVLGLSGGLDSTVAICAAALYCDLYGKNRSDICAITMPGFGTSDRTYNNAKVLAESLGVELKEISIVKAVSQHLEDINHPLDKHDVTYENAQARERTQILMDVANAKGGIVLGTGDMSELALGWCTYNGDQMSMYNINCGVPKTLMAGIIQAFIDATQPGAIAEACLRDVIATPISPELVPGKQHTELVLGRYELHDFIMYYYLRYHERIATIKELLAAAFEGDASREEVEHAASVFEWRIKTQQFKRAAAPEGPVCFPVSVSASAWAIPSDI
ncbi:MAG: NAD(+) synthase [Kiritimatiellae bacterium]|nr:NAD(+) synthase [Kiritimatiellia bacterium]